MNSIVSRRAALLGAVAALLPQSGFAQQPSSQAPAIPFAPPVPAPAASDAANKTYFLEILLGDQIVADGDYSDLLLYETVQNTFTRDQFAALALADKSRPFLQVYYDKLIEWGGDLTDGVESGTANISVADFENFVSLTAWLQDSRQAFQSQIDLAKFSAAPINPGSTNPIFRTIMQGIRILKENDSLEGLRPGYQDDGQLQTKILNTFLHKAGIGPDSRYFASRDKPLNALFERERDICDRVQYKVFTILSAGTDFYKTGTSEHELMVRLAGDIAAEKQIMRLTQQYAAVQGYALQGLKITDILPEKPVNLLRQCQASEL